MAVKLPRCLGLMAAALLLGAGCAAPASSDNSNLVFATELLRFESGDGAGYGQDEMPEIVLGAPGEASESTGSLHVLSLGVGGHVELGFGNKSIIDGPGADFVVFENAFWPGGNQQKVWAELGEVSVSVDGAKWITFPCDHKVSAAISYPGCAGWTPTRAFDLSTLFELDPEVVGGDAFDLADVGLTEARFVRILDLSSEGAPPSAGFDLDAVGVFHWTETTPEIQNR